MPRRRHDPDPNRGSPLKASWEQCSRGAEPPIKGWQKWQALQSWGWAPRAPGPLRRQSNSSQQITPTTAQRELAVQVEPWPRVIQAMANPAEPWQLIPAPTACPASREASPTSWYCGKGKDPSCGKEAQYYFSPPPLKNYVHSCCYACVYSSAVPAAPVAHWGCQQKYPGGELPALLHCWCMGSRQGKARLVKTRRESRKRKRRSGN